MNNDKSKHNALQDLITSSHTTPSIPRETIDHVIRLSDDMAIWVKLVPGGFQFTRQGKIVPEIVGRLVAVEPYLINFDGGDRQPAKRPHVESDLDIPEGYSRRCDIKISAGGQVIGISLAPSSMKFQLSPYLKYLTNQSLRPEQVTTKLTSKQASNQMGTFQVVVFEMTNTDRTQRETPSEKPPVKESKFPCEWA